MPLIKSTFLGNSSFPKAPPLKMRYLTRIAEGLWGASKITKVIFEATLTNKSQVVIYFVRTEEFPKDVSI